jgi:hypothetical protein
MHQVTDPKIPAMPLLMGQGAREVINGALSGQGMIATPTRVRQVRYLPGSSLVVQYDASVAWVSGEETNETFVCSSGRAVPTGGAVVNVEGSEVGVWRFPDDPYLPGLRAAMNPNSVLAVFRTLGVEAHEVSLRRRAYRPSRRAVVEATTPDAKLYLKVLRPARVEDLQKRHTSMSGVVPVPKSHGWNRELGIVVLEAISGDTLRASLGESDNELPTAPQVIALLDALPSPPAVPTSVSGPASRAAEFGRLVSTVMPEAAHAVDAISSACAKVADRSEHETVPVHGDYHSSQILVSGGSIAGLVDVDSAGLGYRVHDFAQLLAHLAVLGQENPQSRFNSYGQTLASAFDRLVDPVELRLNVAGAILGFATGPFRVQEQEWPTNTTRRIDLAHQWVESAGAAS